MNGTTQFQTASAGSKKVWLWIIVGAVALVVLGLAYYLISTPASAPSEESDTTAAIEEELQGVSLEGLDSELGDIDKELNQ